eukprot:7201328-Karenia_brevis.AAC.1
MDEEDAVAAGSEKDRSAGQASVICRKSDEQRDLENTKAPRGRVEFHDPLTNPNMGGMNEPFEKLLEGIAYNGDGLNEDGQRIAPKLKVDRADIHFFQIHRWGGDFFTPYNHDEFIAEADSYDPVALLQQMCIYRKFTVEKIAELRQKQLDNTWTTSDRSAAR